MPRAGPKKVQDYSAEFKLAAVRLSRQPGVQVQAVAAALDIHPFMLSRWRKAVREGRCAGSGWRCSCRPTARDSPAPGARARACAAARGARPPKKSHPVLGRTKADAFAFIDAQRGQHAVTRLVRCTVSRARATTPGGDGPLSAHAAQDRELERRIQQVFQRHRGTYGSPRIHRVLHAERVRASVAAGSRA